MAWTKVKTGILSTVIFGMADVMVIEQAAQGKLAVENQSLRQQI